MGLVVKKPGVITTVQDRGRFGHQGSGFATNGVMDHRAYRIANLLVENDPDAPVLEFALAGPTLRFTTTSVFAVTGGEFSPTLNDAPVPAYAAVMARRGDVLQFKACSAGCYGYLAFAGGGLNVPKVMGSASTNLKCQIGGWNGGTLAAGDYLPFVTRNFDFLPNLGSHRLEEERAYYGFSEAEVSLRVVPGPQESLFTDEGIRTFYREPFTVTAKSDRMGYRLDGPEIQTRHGSDIISDGIAFGAVQIPSQGRPIIMLADRQTTGGYAKIGTVASVDIPRLVQRRPGSVVRFEPVSVQEAQQLLREQEKHYESLAVKVRRPSADGISPRRTARRLTPILEEQARRSKADELWIVRGIQADRDAASNPAPTLEVARD